MNDNNHLDSKKNMFFFRPGEPRRNDASTARGWGFSAGWIRVNPKLTEPIPLTHWGGMGGIPGVCPLIFRPLTQEEVRHQAAMLCGTQTMPTSARSGDLLVCFSVHCHLVRVQRVKSDISSMANLIMCIPRGSK